jgi:energy-coupling factor transporter ATP-binding protein EcfA2
LGKDNDVDLNNRSKSADLTEEQDQWLKKMLPAEWLIDTKIKPQNDINNSTNNLGDQPSLNIPKKHFVTYKYSSKGQGPLLEAVLLEGKPVFLSYKNEMKMIEYLELPNRILHPPNEEEYPHEPYNFANFEEISHLVEVAKSETIDSLFGQAISIVEKYNDQDEYKLKLIAADIVWSYFQDKFSTTHYVAVVGDNGSGKSTIGHTFEAVGYRVTNMTDPTPSNIFRSLGKIEAGQITLVCDEAEKIDQSQEMMSILKTGYQIKGRMARVNMNTQKQEFFYPYCFKMFISERFPDAWKAKGVLERTFKIVTYSGKPQFDIKEILTPSGNQRRQTLLDELNHFRKLMFVYRLIHFDDEIADIDVGLEGRDKELCKPILQLFNKTPIYIEIRQTLQEFLDEKNNRKTNTLEAALCPILAQLVSTFGIILHLRVIWSAIRETISGTWDDRKPNEYLTEDYGILYRNTITNIICDKFGADKKRKNDGTILIFNTEKILKISKSYGVELSFKTTISEYASEGSEGSEDFQEGYIAKINDINTDRP